MSDESVQDEIRSETRDNARGLGGLVRGLENFWYPILYADELGDKPLSIRRFGEDLVLWRNAEGHPHVFENHCPHRRAPLSQGKIEGKELVCSYHGWHFDGAGDCTDMPLEAPGRVKRVPVCVKAYAAEDRAGYIWMFYGKAAKRTPLVVPKELEDPERLHFNINYVWPTNWMNILDNVLDPLHAIYLHAGAVTQKKRAKFKKFEITHEDEQGLRLGKVGYRDDGTVGSVEGEVEFLMPNTLRLDIANGTPEGVYRVVIMATPIDEGHSCAFYARSRRGHGMKRLQWRLWWALHGRQVHRVAEQDREIMAGLGPVEDAHAHENLVVSDTGVARLRRHLRRAQLRNQETAG